MKFEFEKPGIHETQLRKYFKDFDFPEDTVAWPGPVCIMVFMNRSGSSMICENMRSTGKFTGFGEPLNYDIIIKRAEEHGLKSFPAYFEWLQCKVLRENTMFGLKASCDQVMMLLRSGAIPRLFKDIRWVVIQRNDVLSQAVSFSIADQTKQWHSFQQGVKREAKYSFKDIKARIHHIAEAYATMNVLMSMLGVKPYRINYEDFSADVELGTQKFAAYLGLESVSRDPSRLRMKKQRTSRNQEFRERFMSDYLKAQSIELPSS